LISSKSRVLFRADGDNVIGLGHVYRCIAIAERLGNKFDCYFAIRNPSTEITKAISLVADIIVLPEQKKYIVEAKELVETIINKYKIKIAVLDGYYFDTLYQETIKATCNALLISIDDDQPFHYVADIVINHSAGISADKISVEPGTKTLLGYDFLLLRRQFIDLIQKEKKVNSVRSVLICFGGSDANDFTGKMLEYIKSVKFITKLTVIVGSSYKYIDRLKTAIAERDYVELKFNVNAEDLASLMHQTDVAIVPASTIALEAFTAKMIILTGMTANNQQSIYDGLIKEENVIGIGSFEYFTDKKLIEAFQYIWAKFNNYTIAPKANVVDRLLDVFESV